MKVLVTGADGFVGSWMVPHLAGRGHEVVAAVLPGQPPDALGGRRACLAGAAEVIELDVTEPDSVAGAVDRALDGVIHLAAVASVSDGRKDPGRAWEVNAAGTARLAEALAPRGASGPTLLVVSTAEVYGRSGQAVPITEECPARPLTAYAASKLGAEIAAMSVHGRTGLPVVVARAFPHTGPRQTEAFVAPAFAKRLWFAKRHEAPVVGVGNLEPVREFMHVRDVVAAYELLLQRGRAGEVYNVAAGEGLSLRDLFLRLADAIGHHAVPETDANLVRPVDVTYLVGDSAKLRRDTGWVPTTSVDHTIAEVADAQAD